MKSKLFILFFFSIFFQPLLAENLNIQSKNISIDKKTKLTIFRNEVVATDSENNIFKTEYAEYSKDLKLNGLKSLFKDSIGYVNDRYYLHKMINFKENIAVSLHIYSPPNHNTIYYDDIESHPVL